MLGETVLQIVVFDARAEGCAAGDVRREGEVRTIPPRARPPCARLHTFCPPLVRRSR